MKSVDLSREKPELSQLLHAAEQEPVLLVTPDGHEFLLSEADDFEAEVDALRKSAKFQAFLDERMAEKKTVSIEEIDREIQEELKAT